VIERTTETTAASPFALELAREGVTVVEAAGFMFVARLLTRGDARGSRALEIPRSGLMEALFDADGIAGGLCVRGYRPGDRVRPLGMTGTRKVHDVMVDRKLPRERRATWPVVEGGGEILWIPGMVRSRVALVSEATETVLRLTAKPRANLEKSTLLRN
jgi:tRNA(Ile)-lysidine synthase